MHAPVVVLGGGPGGYAAAFMAADQGLEVTLVEMESRLGGTCGASICCVCIFAFLKFFLHNFLLVIDVNSYSRYLQGHNSSIVDSLEVFVWLLLEFLQLG